MRYVLFIAIGVLFSAAVKTVLHKKPFPKIFSKPEDQAFIVSIKLLGDNFGGTDQRENIFKLEDALSTAIRENNAGEFDGNEFGGGFAILYMYGPSANRLSEVTMPVLTTFHPPAGSYAVKRYGKPGAEEVQIELS